MPFNALSETLSFHKSPQSFISSRLADIARTDPSQLPSTNASSVIRASILNRNVHVISDHQMCLQVLSSLDNGSGNEEHGDACPFQAVPAYNDLMAPFFPPPNLLLSDGAAHAEWKDRWRHQLMDLPDTLESLLSTAIISFVHTAFHPDTTVDIYAAMKTLAWQLLFTTFLTPLSGSSESLSTGVISEIEQLQESLLRGQFSTFPVSIRTPFWSSPRNRGISARMKLQTTLKDHFTSQQRDSPDAESPGSSCPLLARHDIKDREDIAHHVLLFTSGLANKALSSLLTSSIINIFLYRPQTSMRPHSSAPPTTLASLLRSLPHDSAERGKMLKSILLETERLFPPVVGVLRRATEDRALKLAAEGETHSIPKGHEAWLYFPSASRSSSVFGEDAELFKWDRFMHSAFEDEPAQESFAFGAGPKTCLGQDVSRRMVELVINALLDSDLELEAIPGNGLEPGVQAMLGWCTIEEAGGVAAIARDLKQLPTQRPRRPVLVKVASQK